MIHFGISIMHYEFHFTCVSAIFSLKWPCRVIKTLRENLVQLNLSGADKVIRGDSIVVPNSDIDLTKAFNEGKHKLLLKNRVFSTICACFGSELVGRVFKANIRILS